MTAWLALGLNLVAIAVTVILLTRRIDARMRQDVALDDIKREVGGIITELNQTTERNIALIEDRIGKLDDLIGRADRRITVLQRLEDRDRSTQRTYSHLRQSVPANQEKPDNRSHGAEERATSSSGSDDADSIKINLSGSGPPAPTKTGSQTSFREQVRHLYQEGLSPEKIASRLGTTVGEVDLVISLDER